MKRTAELVVFLLLIFSVALVGHGMELGAKLGIQTPSLVIQASLHVTPNVAMGIFLESPIEPIINPAASQTPSITIGFIGTYQFINVPFPLKPYIGLSEGVSFEVPGSTASVAVDALIGVRIPLLPGLSLFAEATFSIVPLPDPTTWYNFTSWHKNFYLGFAFLI